MPNSVYSRALDYHRFPKPGKLEIRPTKPLSGQQDLSLAYSPGVAAACNAIAENPEEAANLTSRANLIAVISNGTAVLGLGNIGPLAAKPVMEGKAVLFKKFAGIDVFDIEINETDPDKLVDIIASLEPTFGGINLEDIKAPECFEIEKRLTERLRIPVFHDDQHGTAIIVAAAVLNGLKLVNKNIQDVKLVTSGAGAGALACLDLLISLGLNIENVIVCDSKGPLYKGRTEEIDETKKPFLRDTKARTLKNALDGADVFLGLSVGKVVTQDMVKSMARDPLILALANPEPEISPPLVKEVRPDAIIATGRSDYPNQVNNVLCFPYVFRGALDVGATVINKEMKIACVKALAQLAQAESSDVVSSAYGGEIHKFGPEYIIPKPFDPRLICELSYVVAKAAMETGVATRPIKDLDAYWESLKDQTCKSSMVMKPIMSKAKEAPKRIAFAEGEEERVLQAAQILVDEEIAHPILIGRPSVILKRIEKLSLRLDPHKDVTLIDPNHDERYNVYWKAYHQIVKRKGITPSVAKNIIRTDTTVIAAMMVVMGDADTLICGTIGRYVQHLRHVKQILGTEAPHRLPSTLCGLIMERREPIFICDAYVNPDPSPYEIAETTVLAANQVSMFGIKPKIALVSHSSFGSSNQLSALKMRKAMHILQENAPQLEIEGEMHCDSALSYDIRQVVFPDGRFEGPANLLIMPNLDAGHITLQALKVLCNAQMMGPILLGIARPGHILTHSVTVREIVDMTALAVVDVQHREKAA